MFQCWAPTVVTQGENQVSRGIISVCNLFQAVDQRTIQAIVVGVLGTFAVGFSATTLTSTLAPVSSSGDGAGYGFTDPPQPSGNSPLGAINELWLQEPMMVLVSIALFVVLAHVVTNWKKTVVLSIFLVVLIGAIWLLSQHIRLPHARPDALSPLVPNIGSGKTSGGKAGAVQLPRLLRFGVILVVGGLGLLLVIMVSSTDRSGIADRLFTTEADITAIGRAAGRAADRIETTRIRDDEFDNEVYRAWYEMTTRLDVSRPETSTPGEFADAAIKAGMAPEHVHDLTHLFESVRYGEDTPNDANERRAVRIFRHIEDEYTA